MPQTAAALRVDPLDPAQARRGAARLLARYLRRYGNERVALAAYVAGPRRVAGWSVWPPRVTRYVDAVLRRAGP